MVMRQKFGVGKLILRSLRKSSGSQRENSRAGQGTAKRTGKSSNARLQFKYSLWNNMRAQSRSSETRLAKPSLRDLFESVTAPPTKAKKTKADTSTGAITTIEKVEVVAPTPTPVVASPPAQITVPAITPPQLPQSLTILNGTPLAGGGLQILESSQPSTLDLLNPNGKFRQSVEAFILDQRSEHTRSSYGKDLKRFFKFLHGRNFQQGPEQVSRTLLINYKEYLLSEGLEHTSVDRHLATLKSFFKWLVEDGLLIKSPADGVRFLNPKRISPTRGFSDEEVRKVLSLPNLHTRTGSLHYAILMVLFYGGLRRSELCALKTSNISMERNQRVLRLRGKGNAERIIVMIPAVWNAIQHYFYIAQRKMNHEGLEQFLFLPQRNNRTGVLNKSLDPSMIFYIVTKYSKEAGIVGRVSPHSCRATAISNARDHHVPDRAIQEFAGWASTDMITRYDKRKTAVEDSAAHAIFYGAENRTVPVRTHSDHPLAAEAPLGKEDGDAVGETIDASTHTTLTLVEKWSGD